MLEMSEIDRFGAIWIGCFCKIWIFDPGEPRMRTQLPMSIFLNPRTPQRGHMRGSRQSQWSQIVPKALSRHPREPNQIVPIHGKSGKGSLGALDVLVFISLRTFESSAACIFPFHPRNSPRCLRMDDMSADWSIADCLQTGCSNIKGGSKGSK